uniref:Uncharacterized protein n=1 Tax=Rhizophora mucronata TaxID=61149 RepID=A0A2P2PQW3_RHIMU
MKVHHNFQNLAFVFSFLFFLNEDAGQDPTKRLLSSLSPCTINFHIGKNSDSIGMVFQKTNTYAHGGAVKMSCHTPMNIYWILFQENKKKN